MHSDPSRLGARLAKRRGDGLEGLARERACLRAWNSEIRSQIDFANPSYTAGI